jgi:cytochrome d ubiquinol oxidase subunit I
MMDPVFLSRLQFAFTIGFHYLFPPLTIGLGFLMVIMEGSYLVTKNPIYEVMAKFWTKIFALIFAIGVASGIVMEFQFGTNWSTYSRMVGDIFGAALAAEGIFAFFLESGFLAVLVFGWDLVSPRVHFFSTLMVSLGSIFSAVWIVVANSWQQTPAGYKIVTDAVTGERTAELTDFFAAVLNPSTLERLSHTLVGAFIGGAFLVLSVASFYLIRGRHQDFAKKSIAIALPFALFWSIMALVTGHSNALMVTEHQPAKLAAMEGVFETKEASGLALFGWVDVENERVIGPQIPGALSFLVHGDWTTPVTGFDEVKRAQSFEEKAAGAPLEPLAKEDRPPIQITFQAYHIMVGLGMLFILLTAVATFFLWRKTLFEKRWLLWVMVFAVAGPLLVNELGWIVAEVGRQPWIVWGELETAAAASPTVGTGELLFSIIGFGVIYLTLLIGWLYLLDTKIRTGPQPVEELLAARERKGGFFEAAARLADPSGEHLASDRNDEQNARKEDQR